MRRASRFLATWVLAVGAAGRAAADPPAPPSPAATRDPVEVAADAVLAAVAAGDVEGVEALASARATDPWLVADALLARSRREAAAAFAGAGRRVDTERLPAYVAGWRARDDDASRRSSLARANDAFEVGRDAEALEAYAAGGVAADDVVGMRLAYGRGLALRDLARLREASKEFRVAADAALAVGWLARASLALHEAAHAAYRLGDLPSAIADWTRRLAVAERCDDRGVVAATASNLGIAHDDAGNSAVALAFHRRAAVGYDGLDDRRGSAQAWGNACKVAADLRIHEEALEAGAKALALFRGLHDRAAQARVLLSLATVDRATGDRTRARERATEARDLAKAAGDAVRESRALQALALLRQDEGDAAGARDLFLAAIPANEAAGDSARVAFLLSAAGDASADLSDWSRLLELDERTCGVLEAAGDVALAQIHRARRGDVYLRTGEREKALEAWRGARDRVLAIPPSRLAGKVLRRAGDGFARLRLNEEARACFDRAWPMQTDDPSEAATTFESLGLLAWNVHDVAGSTAAYEEAVSRRLKAGQTRRAAEDLDWIGEACRWSGDHARALDAYERSLRLWESLGVPDRLAAVTSNLGSALVDLGDLDRGVPMLERALKAMEDLGSEEDAATTTSSLARARSLRKDYAEATALFERAYERWKALGDPAGMARALANMGAMAVFAKETGRAVDLYRRAIETAGPDADDVLGTDVMSILADLEEQQGQRGRAMEMRRRVLARSRDEGDHDGAVGALRSLAADHFALGQLREAADAAREGVAELSASTRGLPDERAAAVRVRNFSLFEKGVQAGVFLQDAAVVSFFLESSRAVSFLEAARDRERGRLALADPRARAEETEARAREERARTCWRESLGADPDVRAPLKEAWQEARREVRAVLERLERTAKTGSGEAKAAELDEIRAALRADEVWVAYAFGSLEAVALVADRDGARVVRLGPAKAIRDACAALRSAARPYLRPEALDRLRDLVATPLALAPGSTRLLVSPDGILHDVPFALLFPGRDAVLEPSGTGYLVLRGGDSAAGQGVLAVADAELGSPEEARAVGDLALVGPDGTKAALAEALAGRPRWRALHVACHGLVDVERPALSALALAPVGGDDGRLTALDVLRLPMRCDLAALSACETAKGKVLVGEGNVGLSRAFLLAGASRVLCSLWRVDADATRALMTAFYAAWNPRDGSAPLGAARALRVAQEHVRTHEVERPDPEASAREGRSVTRRERPWEHPDYWAAWVLWGVPD